MNFILVQGLGFVALSVGICSYQLNKRKHILLVQSIYHLLFGLQYLLLGSLVSMLLCIIGTARNIIFTYDYKYSKKTRYIILISIILSTIISTYYFWNGYLGLFSFMGTMLETLATWQYEEKHIREVSLFCLVTWLVHDILIGSYGAVIDDLSLVGSIIIGMFRFDSKKCKAK
jgi:hypothetical protein